MIWVVFEHLSSAIEGKTVFNVLFPSFVGIFMGSILTILCRKIHWQSHIAGAIRGVFSLATLLCVVSLLCGLVWCFLITFGVVQVPFQDKVTLFEQVSTYWLLVGWNFVFSFLQVLWTLDWPTVAICIGIWKLKGYFRRPGTLRFGKPKGGSSGILDGTQNGGALSIHALTSLRLADMLQQLLGDSNRKLEDGRASREDNTELPAILEALTEIKVLYNKIQESMVTQEGLKRYINQQLPKLVEDYLNLNQIEVSDTANRRHSEPYSGEEQNLPVKMEAEIGKISMGNIGTDYRKEDVPIIQADHPLEAHVTVDEAGIALLNPIIHTGPTVPKPQKKGASAVNQAPITEDLRQNLGASQTIGELKEQIKLQEAEIKKKRQALQKLTPEEYGLSREEIMAKWAKEDRSRKYGDVLAAELTEEEWKMNKTELRRKWAKEAHDVWIRRQKAMGREVYICEGCNTELVVGDTYPHRCFVAFTGPIDRRQGVPRQKEVLVAQNRTGAVQIRQQTAINLEEYRKILDNSQTLFEKLRKIEERMGHKTSSSPGDERASAEQSQPTGGETGHPAPKGIIADDDEDIEIENETNFRLVAP
jgi:hypothetical protein